MGTFIRLESQHSLFLNQLKNILKLVGIALRQVHHGNNLVVSVFADNVVVIFREKLIKLGADILDRNLVFHPLSVLRVYMSKPFIFKVGYIFSVVFLGYAVLQQSVGKETVSVGPELLLKGCFLIGCEVFPHVLYPSYGKVRHQSCRIECSCKGCSHLELYLFKSSADACTALCKSFLFLLYLSCQIC